MGWEDPELAGQKVGMVTAEFPRLPQSWPRLRLAPGKRVGPRTTAQPVTRVIPTSCPPAPSLVHGRWPPLGSQSVKPRSACRPPCSSSGNPVLRGVVVPAGDGPVAPHHHPAGGLRAGPAQTEQEVQGLQHRCVASTWFPAPRRPGTPGSASAFPEPQVLPEPWSRTWCWSRSLSSALVF